MTARRCALLSLVFITAADCKGSEQHLIDCATCSIGVEAEFCFNFSITTTVINCEAITSSSGSASGTSVETTIGYSHLSPSCFPENPPIATLESYISGGPTAAAATLVNGTLNIGGGGGACTNGFGFHASLGGLGSCFISSSVSSKSEFYSSSVSQNFPPFALLGNEYVGVFGSSSVQGDVQIEASEPLEIVLEIEIDATGTWVPINTCIEMPGIQSAGVEADILSGIYFIGGVSSSFGMLAMKDSGPFVRLGLFADTGYAETNSSESTSLAGTVSVSLTSASGGLVDITDDWFSYSVAKGDVNGDGYITLCDESELVSLLGTAAGDGSYDPRADMDIDGDVDSADLNEAIIIYENTIANYFCPGDYDGSGALNFLDVSEFLADYALQKPKSDYNCDGMYNFLDNSAFLAAYAAGCN